MRTLKSFTADNEFILTDQINLYAKGNELQIVSIQTHALEKDGKTTFSAFVLYEWTEEEAEA
ncbi:hypothetical protein BEP19_01235 [Ammoniphilus oxalaticus]|uniref:Uncharacterized protein n=1 Tax=Ammoniphilus oxalaticus TaxID=66863 RepID=A0A419SMR6_9BACL|nr:hypothetical protein [Ammoniphilus oxalaticus]RKD25596.1 hypothetical protein BEP19_01235 [Ammoniphilus oxalaticus]